MAFIHLNEGETKPRGHPLKPLEVSKGAREELESLARARSLPSVLMHRAKLGERLVQQPMARGHSRRFVSRHPPSFPILHRYHDRLCC